MPKVNFPIVGDYKVEQDLYVCAADTVNMYVLPATAERQAALLPTPGLKKVATISQGKIGRAMFTIGNYMYVVISQYVYQIDSALNKVLIGTLSTDNGPVGISTNNGNQIIFMDGINGWVWNTTSGTFTKITDSGFVTAPLSVTFMDGYFIANDGATNQWQISALNDGFTWNAAQNAFFESRSEIIQAVIANKEVLYVLGRDAMEVWIDVGTSLFPFQRDNNMLFQIGCASFNSIAQAEDRLLWLGQTTNGVASVYMTMGGAPQIVSTTQVDYAISKYTTVSDASAYIFKENGHLFYALNFTTANTSWLYDITTNMWFRQQMLDGSRHIIEDHVYFNGKHYACAYNNPNIYEINTQYSKNDQDDIVRDRVLPRFYDPSFKIMRINSITLGAVQGLGSANGTDKFPFVELLVSKDGGRTYGKIERGYIGRQGLNQNTTIWYNKGVNKDFVFKLRCYNGIRYVDANAAINYDLIGP